MAAHPNRTSQEKVHSSEERNVHPQLFAVVLGFFFAVTVLKFGNPVILDEKVTAPQNWLEMVFQPWPIKWGYLLFIPVAITGLLAANWRTKIPKWILFTPSLWLGWQFISATQTVDAELTSATLKHYSVCVLFFYFGCFSLRGGKAAWPVWTGLLVAFVTIIRMGFDQHFGGLEQVRKLFYELPNWQMYPAEFLKKLAGDRIYSTLFYPNTLAGAILLFLPLMLIFLWQALANLGNIVRIIVLVTAGLSSLACLYWSGSKAGWLVALVVGMVALLHLPVRRFWKMAAVIALVVLGLAGFAIKYAKFFERGSTSVVARFDYWRAALKTAQTHPVFGTGPGTFFRSYQQMKRPEAEMTRLCHNDYLQQASDTGIIGCISYLALVIGSLASLYRYRNSESGLLASLVWLGLLGFSLHSFVEFHIFIPALAWPWFLMLGWLWNCAASTNPSTNSKAVSNVTAAK